jgi:hypothetical protein
VNDTATEWRDEPRAGSSGYSCSKVKMELSSFVGETEGESKATVDSLISSVELTLVVVNNVPRYIGENTQPRQS